MAHRQLPRIALEYLGGGAEEETDVLLAGAAAAGGVPFIHSTISNDPMEEIATVAGSRRWWQLSVFLRHNRRGARAFPPGSGSLRRVREGLRPSVPPCL
jgi:hypothetical protein